MENMGLNFSFWKNKRVLITGNTGFKGSWLTIWLNKLGAKISGYSLPAPTNPSLFEVTNVSDIVSVKHGDVRDYKALMHVISTYQPEIIIHMAAQSLVRYSYQNPLETYETNVMGTVNLLEGVRNCKGVKAVVIVTSDKCYENKNWVQGYKENDPIGGHDPYSSSKGCAELVTKAYLQSYFNADKFGEHNVAVASVRAGNVIGGGDWAEDRLIPDCMKALFADEDIIIRYPEAIRPWQHVLEPLWGYMLLAKELYEQGSASSGAWNFGPDDDSCKPVKWLVERILKNWGTGSKWRLDGSYKPFEANFLRLDSSKAKVKLNWGPKWDIKSALDKTLEWYKDFKNGKNMMDVTIKQIDDYENCLGKPENL